MSLPLDGIRVLDFSQAFFGPLAAAMLGDMGADVIKIEGLSGEAGRHGGIIGGGMENVRTGAGQQSNDAATWMSVNRSKRSLAVDLRHKSGKEIVLRLAEQADVILQSFRPGVADAIGIGYETMSRNNPRVVYCWVWGYGAVGPLAHRRGGDPWAQAMAGVVSRLGTPSGPPLMVPFNFIDQGGAALAAYGIMLALFVRERTGIGQEITLNLIDAAIHLQTIEVAEYLVEGKLKTKLGKGLMPPPFGSYRAKDGDIVTIFGTGPQWPAFCKLVGLEGLAQDPRFDSDEKRYERREELYNILDKAFSKRTRAEWQDLFRAGKMRCDPCLTYEELLAHPQVAANETILTVEHPARGKVKLPGIPVTLKKTPGKARMAAPMLGQHTREVLRGLGYSPDQVDEFIRKGAVKARD